MKKISGNSNGAEFIRGMVRWLNSRDEHLNEGKSPLTLINEYKRYLEKVK